MRQLANTWMIATSLLFTTSHADAQRKRVKKPAVSETTLSLYEPGEFKGVKYRLMKPIDFDASKTYPLVLILHGAGGRGSDNIQNLRNWNEWMAAEDLRRKHPAFVLAPQTSTPWSDPTSPFAKAPTIDDVFTAHVFERLKEIGGNLKFTTLRGVKHGANTPAFHYNGDDPAKGFFTAYASDRPDKTEDIWDWLFNQAR